MTKRFETVKHDTVYCDLSVSNCQYVVDGLCLIMKRIIGKRILVLVFVSSPHKHAFMD